MTNLPIFVERSKNRTSRAILRNDTITIRLARGLSLSEEQRHIDILVKRMVKAHAKEVTRMKIDPFRPLLTGESSLTLTLVTGSTIHFQVDVGTRTRAVATEDGWKIMRSAKTEGKVFHRFLWKLLASSSQEDTENLVHQVNRETFSLPVKKVTLKLMKSRWGSCSRRGDIALSTPLLLTTPSILRYVIIHELAHIPHPNHSYRFWFAVEEKMPEYRTELKALKHFTLPTL
jgi:predicted metal-dependent hydrolase